MKSMEIISAVQDEEHGYIVVAKQITNDDDSVEFAGHSFYPESVEWIGAVYDTKDMDEIIDLILYEPYVENIDPTLMSASEAKTKHKELIDTFKIEKKDKQFKKSSAVQAIRNSEVPNVFADAAVEDAYEVIKRLCPIDDDLFEAKKAHADRVRQQRRAGKREPTKEEKLRKIKGDSGSVVRTQQPEVRQTKVKVLPTVTLERGRRVKK